MKMQYSRPKDKLVNIKRKREILKVLTFSPNFLGTNPETQWPFNQNNKLLLNSIRNFSVKSKILRRGNPLHIQNNFCLF